MRHHVLTRRVNTVCQSPGVSTVLPPPCCSFIPALFHAFILYLTVPPRCGVRRLQMLVVVSVGETLVVHVGFRDELGHATTTSLEGKLRPEDVSSTLSGPDTVQGTNIVVSESDATLDIVFTVLGSFDLSVLVSSTAVLVSSFAFRDLGLVVLHGGGRHLSHSPRGRDHTRRHHKRWWCLLAPVPALPHRAPTGQRACASPALNQQFPARCPALRRVWRAVLVMYVARMRGYLRCAAFDGWR